MTDKRRIIVIGGGITGLAAAHRLGELDPTADVTLLESSGRLGGVLETTRDDGYLIEHSADSFITNVPWGIDLCRRLGVDLVETDERYRRALVVRGGRLEPIPDGFSLLAPARLGPILATRILSPWGKLRLLAEYFVPRRATTDDESLAAFASRRLGRETFERIVQPLVGGIYTADPQRLSMAATMPRFLEMERQHGGLIRGARRKIGGDADSVVGTGARYALFVAPRDGMSSLVAALANRLRPGTVRLNTTVTRLERKTSGGWRLTLAAPDAANATLECDAVVIAVSAPRAAQLLADFDRELAADLRRIEYAGTTIVSLAYRREQISHPLDAFGFVVPAIENRPILSASFSSIKFAGRAPTGHVLIRVFFGGACQSEMNDFDDARLTQLATDELAQLIGAAGNPFRSHIFRWPRSMPQYHVGHLQLVASIERRASDLAGLALAGNAYQGVGIPVCIHSGELAAERVLAH